MRKGFTLFDVMISVFILGLLVYVLSTSFLHLRPKYALQKTVWEIHSRLHSARYKALTKGEKVRIKFSSKAYSVEVYNETQKEWEIGEKHTFEGVILEANNNPCFHPNGAVSNLASIYVSNSWGKYKITIAITGRVKTVRINSEQ